MAADEQILTEIDGSGIAVVTLNRPAKRNAIALAMWQRLGPIFQRLDADPQVRVVVLTGAAGHFSGGADISEFATVRADDAGNQIYDEAADAATRAIRDCSKPTIAAVHGAGVGGGCGLALACDLRVGDASTRMGIPAAQRGLVYGPLDTSLVLRQLGLAKAKLVLFTARIFPLPECVAMGLIDIVGADGALPEALAQARAIAGNAPLSVRGSKVVLEALARDEAAQRAAEIDALVHGAVISADFREASAAFTEKRPARFVGR